MNNDYMVRIDYGALAKRLMNPAFGDTLVATAQKAAVDAAGPFVQRILMMKTPVGATGKARQMVVYERGHLPGYGYVGYAQPAAGYIRFANDGTRPHTPPWEPIAYWAYRKGLNPGAVWWSIKKRGTKGQHFIEASYQLCRVPAQKLMAAAAEKVLSGMGA